MGAPEHLCRRRTESAACHRGPVYRTHFADRRFVGVDIVVDEALDRPLRDQEPVAALYQQVSFAGAKAITPGEGNNGQALATRGSKSAMSLACSSSILRMSSIIFRVVGSSFPSQRTISE